MKLAAFHINRQYGIRPSIDSHKFEWANAGVFGFFALLLWLSSIVKHKVEMDVFGAVAFPACVLLMLTQIHDIAATAATKATKIAQVAPSQKGALGRARLSSSLCLAGSALLVVGSYLQGQDQSKSNKASFSGWLALALGGFCSLQIAEETGSASVSLRRNATLILATVGAILSSLSTLFTSSECAVAPLLFGTSVSHTFFTLGTSFLLASAIFNGFTVAAFQKLDTSSKRLNYSRSAKKSSYDDEENDESDEDDEESLPMSDADNDDAWSEGDDDAEDPGELESDDSNEESDDDDDDVDDDDDEDKRPLRRRR
mmetsp:Transcript_7806/g.23593  ORF Transcript_7806/g.23593 Transcript_7806/m.23593 type:complete len:314 (+) Transcript_7806:103-1044(+)